MDRQLDSETGSRKMVARNWRRLGGGVRGHGIFSLEILKILDGSSSSITNVSIHGDIGRRLILLSHPSNPCILVYSIPQVTSLLDSINIENQMCLEWR